MRILSLRLKGFKGIKLGALKREEINIDFSQLPDGLIAIRGENGAGKTTILDSLHPYRVMPFRDSQGMPDAVDGTGEKELVFQTVDGRTYKSLLTINEKSRDMVAQLFVYDEDKNSWSTLVDGRTSEYDAAIENILMPESLFFTANFRAQNAKSFVGYKKGDLKDLVEDLTGLKPFLQKSIAARERRLEEERVLELKETESGTLQKTIMDLAVEFPDKEYIKELEKEKTSREKEIRGADSKIGELKGKTALFDEKEKSVRKSLDDLIRNSEGNLSEIKLRGNSLIAKRREYGEIFDKKAEILKAGAELKTALERLKKEQEQIAKKSELLVKKNEITKIEYGHRATLKDLNGRLETAKKSSGVLDEVPCSDDEKSKCKLLANALTAKKEISGLELKVKEAEKQIAEAQKKLSGIDNEIQGLPASVSRELSDEVTRLQKLAAETSTLEMAEKELKSIDNEIADLRSKKNKIEEELKAKKDKTDEELVLILKGKENVNSELRAMDESREAHRLELERISKDLERLALMEKTAVETLKRRKEVEKRIEEIQAQANVIRKDARQWGLIEKGFGRDGLIALELELASPVISDIVNSLLEEMGGRFAVRFETLRPKANKKNEYVETFDIKVLDTETGIEKSLVDLSGGERVWVDEAIARAISVYLSRSAGGRCSYLVSDERDGALDETKKLEYCSMKRQVLKLGGYNQEFFISHTPDLWDLADAVITVDRSGISVDKIISTGKELTAAVPEQTGDKPKTAARKSKSGNNGDKKPRKTKTDKQMPVQENVVTPGLFAGGPDL